MWQDEEDDKKAAEEESEEEDKKDDGRYTVGDVTYLDGKVRRPGSGGRRGRREERGDIRNGK